jgi:hypothetical protein
MAKPEELTIDLLGDTCAVLVKAVGHATAMERRLEEAAQTLTVAADTREKDCRRVLELQHMVSVRLAGLLRRLQEGTP